jgi:hypothetical protein
MKAQLRQLKGNSKVAILVLSDTQLLEMIERKEQGKNPADLLEDILDNLRTSY